MKRSQKRPPWWFVTAIWAGIAGSVGMLAAVIRAGAE
jgi:hypothetical protein